MLLNTRKLLLDGSPASSWEQASRAALGILVFSMLTACGSSSSDNDKKDNDEPDAPTVGLTADPDSIALGGTSTLTWVVSDADDCTASDGWMGAKDELGGDQDVTPAITTTYVLECTGPGGTVSDSATVTVGGAVTASLTATPDSLTAGESTTLDWSSTNATDCSGTNFSTGGAVSGSVDVVVNADTTFDLDCNGAGGTAAADSVTVTALTLEFSSQSVSDNGSPTDLLFSWTIGDTTGIDHYTLEENPDGSSGFSQVDLNGDGTIDTSDEIDSAEVSVVVNLALHFRRCLHREHRDRGPGRLLQIIQCDLRRPVWRQREHLGKWQRHRGGS
ncbi:MAG: hypothetical protein JRE71_07655 [Deltaproteobacteria bacterium]|nr:hypothetical protein [Deltaproteobacteria bacterium]